MRTITLMTPAVRQKTGPTDPNRSRERLGEAGLVLLLGGVSLAVLWLQLWPVVTLWAPLTAMLIFFARKTITQLITTRSSWAEMKEKRLIVGPHSLERLRSALDEWRHDYKHGGARESTIMARQLVSEAGAALVLVFILCHVVFYAVSHEAFSLAAKFSAALAVLACDVCMFCILHVAGQISELMASQGEFISSARLRLAEVAYACSDRNDTMKESMRALHLQQAISAELQVIESYTQGQTFVVYGFAMDPGRASQMVGASFAFMQVFWDSELNPLQMGMDGTMMLIAGAMLLNTLGMTWIMNELR